MVHLTEKKQEVKISGLPFAVDGQLPSGLVVDFDKRLKTLDTPTGVAYEARNVRRGEQPLMAIDHLPGLPNRSRDLKRFASLMIPGLLRPVGHGVIESEDEGAAKRSLVTVLQRPLGPTLAECQLNGNITYGYLNGSFLQTVVKTLKAIHDQGVAHGGINPSRIFWSETSESPPLLGECVTHPAGTIQPGRYEPLERALANPWGRGPAEPADDYFALGVTMLMLMPAAVPAITNEGQLNFARLSKGSYAALFAGQRLSPKFENLLRGLICDDASERWGHEEVVEWLSAEYSKPVTDKQPAPLVTPVSFAGYSISNKRILASVFAASPTESGRFLRRMGAKEVSRDLLEGQLEAEELETSVFAVDATSRSVEKADETLVTGICQMLDPIAPVRFRGVSFNLSGIGTLFAKAHADNDEETVRAVGDFINGHLPQDMLDIGEPPDDEKAELMDLFDAYRRTINNRLNGHGVERLLLDLNPGLECQSPKLEHLWVRSLSDAIRAMDWLAQSGRSPLFDKELAAFIANRNPNLERTLYQMGSGEIPQGNNINELLEMFGTLQVKYETGPLKALCSKFVTRIWTEVRKIRNRKRRARLEALLNQVGNAGDITRLAASLNLDRELMDDGREYAQARGQLRQLEASKHFLDKPVSPKDKRAIDRGYSFAATLGYLMLAATIVYFTSGS